MDPKLKKLLLRVARVLETGGGGYERQRPQVEQEQRSIGPATRGNRPVSKHLIDALPRPRTSKADKVIGGMSDVTPVAAVEAARQGIQQLRGGQIGAGALSLVLGATDVLPGGKGKLVKAAAKTPAKRIAKAAIKLPNGTIHWGRNHAAAIDAARAAGDLPHWKDPKFSKILEKSSDGFVDEGGAYLTRDETTERLRALGTKLGGPGFSSEEFSFLSPKTRAKVLAEDSVLPHGGQRSYAETFAHAALPAKYAILTAENPGGKTMTAARNAQLNRAFEKDLTKRGIKFEKVQGAYTDDATGELLNENSYLLRDVEPNVAEQIGRQWKQNGVVTQAGYHNLAENKLHPSSGVSFVNEQPYTQLPDGRRVRSEIDWGKAETIHHRAPNTRTMGDSVVARAPETLTGVAMRSKRGGRVFQQEGFDGGHDAVWTQVQQQPTHQYSTLSPEQARRMREIEVGHRDSDYEDGFVTSTGRFVGRADALEIAKQSSQWNGRNRMKLEPGGRQGLHTEAVKGNAIRPDSVAVDWASKHAPRAQAETATRRASDAAVGNFRSTAQDIRAFPNQRRRDLIDALKGGESEMGANPFPSPAVHSRKNEWKPTSRGVFERTPELMAERDPRPLPFDVKRKPKSTGLDPVAEQIANDPRVVKRIMSDWEKGVKLGGLDWNSLGPMKKSIEEIGGPFSFEDVNMAGAASSVRTPTHNELANMSLNLWGRAHGKTAEEAREEFFRQFPGFSKPRYMGMHRDLFERGMQSGTMLPSSPTSGALKVPHYHHNRMLRETGLPLDTHEQTMLSQASGISKDEIKAAMNKGGENYMAMTRPYQVVAEKLGLQLDRVQPPRWLGGGLETGLESQPSGDFIQTLEDGLLYTARMQGKDETPKGLHNLWSRIVQGQDFFLPVESTGGFPVY